MPSAPDDPPVDSNAARVLPFRERSARLPVARESERVIADLWQEHHARLRRFAGNIVGESADDVVQEAFIRLWAWMEVYGVPNEPLDFLFTIIRRLAISTVRGEQRERRRVIQWFREWRAAVPLWMRPGAHLAATESEAAMTRALTELTDRERELWLLAQEDGMTTKRLAALVGIKAGTVRTLLARANERLRQALRKEGYGDGKVTHD
jgi:RNA polymerase sigma-70 factor (ECF subfamily)